MTHGGGTDDDGIDEVTRAAALAARHRAEAEMPTPDALADLAARAAARQDPAEVRAETRRLIAEAISNTQRIQYLLGRLTERIPGEGGPGGGP